MSSSTTPDSVELLWIPLGAGAHVVRFCGRIYESLHALRDRRPACDLYHSALQVRLAGSSWAIESAPETNARGRIERGVVRGGSVGLAPAGRLRVFRYEVRRWEGGQIPDARYAVGGPQVVSEDRGVAKQVLELVPSVPTPVWGRDQLRTGDMWNSNSVIAWLLVRAGVDPAPLTPPPHGRAPGWSAGLAVASRW